MKKSKAELTGGKIHKILNHTLSRKLTFKEYNKLIRLIARLPSDFPEPPFFKFK